MRNAAGACSRLGKKQWRWENNRREVTAWGVIAMRGSFCNNVKLDVVRAG